MSTERSDRDAGGELAPEGRSLDLRDARTRLKSRQAELRADQLVLEQHRAALRATLAALYVQGRLCRTLSASTRASRLDLRAELDSERRLDSRQPAQPEPVERASELLAEARAAVAGARLALDRAERELARRQKQARAAAAPAALSRPEQKLLDALAWLEWIGLSPSREVAAACLTGYRVRSAGWVAVCRKLRRRGLVRGGAQLALTDAGRSRAALPEPAGSVDGRHAAVLARLDAAQRRILEALLDAHPRALDVTVLARRSGHECGDASFEAARGRLRDIGLITSPAPGRLRAHDALRRHTPAGEARRSMARPSLLRGGLHFSPATERGRPS